MPKVDDPDVVALFERIARLRPRAVPYDGIIVRSVGTLFANEQEFLSDTGAAMHGGRWNRPGIPAVYASLDVITATREAYQNFISAGFSLSAIRPRVMAGATAKLRLVCDLTDKTIRRRIRFTLDELLSEDWQSIQAAGEE